MLKEFVKKLRGKVPSEDEFVAGFAQLRFSDENTKQKSLVRYVLRRQDAFLRKGAPVDYEKFSIEHIAPQRPTAAHPLSRMSEIGNLMLVPESLNEKLRNQPFLKKKALMIADGLPLDELIRSAVSWGDDEIVARSKALAGTAYNKIFKI